MLINNNSYTYFSQNFHSSHKNINSVHTAFIKFIVDQSWGRATMLLMSTSPKFFL